MCQPACLLTAAADSFGSVPELFVRRLPPTEGRPIYLPAAQCPGGKCQYAAGAAKELPTTQIRSIRSVQVFRV